MSTCVVVHGVQYSPRQGFHLHQHTSLSRLKAQERSTPAVFSSFSYVLSTHSREKEPNVKTRPFLLLHEIKQEALSIGPTGTGSPIRKLLLPHSSPLGFLRRQVDIPMFTKPCLMERVTERHAYAFPEDGLPSGTCENQNRMPQGQNWAPKSSKAQGTQHVWALMPGKWKCGPFTST